VFGSRSGALFDRLAASEAAASLVVSAVFSAQRAERLATQRYASAGTVGDILGSDGASTVTQSVSHRQKQNGKDDNRGQILTRTRARTQIRTRTRRLMRALEGDQRPQQTPENAPPVSLPSLLEVMQLFTRKVIHEQSITSIQALLSTSGSSTASASVTYPLETRLAQSVLINAYLTLVNDPQASAMVAGQVKTHLVGVSKAIQASLASLLASLEEADHTQKGAASALNSTTAKSCDFSGRSTDSCSVGSESSLSAPISVDMSTINEAFEWVAHYNVLLNALAVSGGDVKGKAFLRLLPVPQGPPI
jgi:hypothetical protein